MCGADIMHAQTRGNRYKAPPVVQMVGIARAKPDYQRTVWEPIMRCCTREEAVDAAQHVAVVALALPATMFEDMPGGGVPAALRSDVGGFSDGVADAAAGPPAAASREATAHEAALAALHPPLPPLLSDHAAEMLELFGALHQLGALWTSNATGPGERFSIFWQDPLSQR